MYNNEKNNLFTIREATEDDCELILGFIHSLAVYEHKEDTFVATVEAIRTRVFGEKAAYVLIGEKDGVAVGFALYFITFSTFLGLPGIYLEDLYIKDEYRGMGLGSMLLSQLAAIANERGYGRIEWSCLDWNTSSIEFYKSKGAVLQSGCVKFRLSGDTLRNFNSADIE